MKRRSRTKVELFSNLYHSPLLCLGDSDYYQSVSETPQSTPKVSFLSPELLLTFDSSSTVQLFRHRSTTARIALHRPLDPRVFPQTYPKKTARSEAWGNALSSVFIEFRKTPSSARYCLDLSFASSLWATPPLYLCHTLLKSVPSRQE